MRSVEFFPFCWMSAWHHCRQWEKEPAPPVKQYTTLYRIQSTTTPSAMQHTEYKVQQQHCTMRHTEHKVLQHSTIQQSPQHCTEVQEHSPQHYAAYRIQNTTAQLTTHCIIHNTKHNSTAHSTIQTPKYNSTALYSIYNTKYNTAHSTIQHIENKVHQHSQQHYNTEYKVQQHSTI